jgi:hypothetical protein
MVVGLKLFVTVGGMYTFNVAVARLALFPALVCNAPAGIVFVAAPAVLLVTLTITVHPPAGMDVPLAIVKLPALAVAVTPVHVPVFPTVLIVMPVGNVSVRALVNVMATEFVFPIVTVRFVFPPLARFATAKDFEIVGGTPTVRLALAVPPVNATGPAAVTVPVVLFLTPIVVPVTFTST